MPEWLYEAGIGENRAALVEDGEIIEAAIELDDMTLRVGAVAQARLVDRATGRVRLDDGAEALLNGRYTVPEGGRLTVRIVREALVEPGGRVKPARAVPADEAPQPGPDLLARLQSAGLATDPPPRRRGPGRGDVRNEGQPSTDQRPDTSPPPARGWSYPVRPVLAHGPDLLEQAGWSELLEEARTGDILFGGGTFPGGALRMWPTPAMTLFDVDGSGPLDALAAAAARAVGRAVRRHGIGGSIGVDFPTLAGKAQRQAVAAALDAALPEPFERTAMNGFGFLQIVRPRPRMSLPELLRADPVGAEARAALRRLQREPPGAPTTHRLPAHVLARLQSRPDWLAQLARRTGVTHTLSRNAGEGQPRNAAG